MKKTTLTMLVVALASITMLLSFTNKTETKTYLTDNEIVTSDTKATNIKNMHEAYKAEVISSAKYEAYSQKAEEEGHSQIAMMFSALSKAKSIHADNHMAALEETGETVPEIEPNFNVKSTHENLKDAIDEENMKINKMYPQFSSTAERVDDQTSLKSLTYAHKTAQKHRDMNQRALAALENNDVESLPSVFYVCPNCGNIYENDLPERCEVSGTSSKDFLEISDQTW